MQTKCPNCGSKYEIQDQYAGMELECPSCKSKFTVKEIESVATMPPPPQTKPVTIKQLPPRFVAKNPLEYYVLGLAGVVIFFLGALGFAITFAGSKGNVIAVLLSLLSSSVSVVMAFGLLGFATLVRSTYRSEQYLQHISDRLDR